MNRGDNKEIRKSLSTKKPIDLSASCFMMEINSDCSMSSDGKKNKDNKLKPSKHSQEVINDKLKFEWGKFASFFLLQVLGMEIQF